MNYSTVIYITIQRYALQYSEVSDIYSSVVICITGVVVYYSTVIYIAVQ